MTDPDDLFVKTVPSHLGPLLVVTFKQSESPKGVAVASTPCHMDFEKNEEFYLRQTIRQLRESTIEAHGFDVMPPHDELYYFDPWPPPEPMVYIHWRTTLRWGDGKTNLRDYAAFMLKQAAARGVQIRVPIYEADAPRIR